jgi:glutathione reductase (NADPH)
MGEEYDLIVIGTGSAGRTAAFDCRDAGLSVAIVDERLFGGTCALRGCDPKKVLVGAAEVVARSRMMEGRGISGAAAVRWEDLIAFERGFTEPFPAMIEEAFADAGIDPFHGHARFTGERTIEVGGVPLAADRFVVATGAVPRRLGVPGEDLLATSDDFLGLDRLPDRIVFVGGGVISFEFAHIAARLGAEVTILVRGNRALRKFETGLVEMLIAASRAAGIVIRFDLPLFSVQRHGDGVVLSAGKDGKETFEADLAVHGAGRVPAYAGLGLDRAGIQTDRRGIVVNEYLQSVSNPRVYVAGDANPRGMQLTPVAGRDGALVARNILEENVQTADYTAVPAAVFTLPPLVRVGLTEEEAQAAGMRYRVTSEDTSGWYTSRRIGLAASGYTILTDAEGGRILGAHLLGHNADEIINIFALALREGLGVEALGRMIWAYPTSAWDIGHMV